MDAKIAKYICPHCKKQHPRIIDVCPGTGLAVAENFRLEGEVIDGKYRLLERIGEGGMGVIYRAVHTTIHRPLAVKILNPELQTSDEIVIRFQNEAKIAASVGHRAIVDVIDMGKFKNKFHYIAMEFIDGEDVGYLLEKKAKLDIKEAVDIIIEVLDGLSAVHKKNIIHRDLKPENIIVGKDSAGNKIVKIVDFGISRILQEAQEGQKRLTKDGTVFGTPTYMAPEQARGKRELDGRTDLYSVGAILYEMLTGVPPFEGENINELLFTIVNEKPTNPRDIRAEIPDNLSEIILKSLAKNPEDRFQDARQFIEALAPFASTPLFMRYSTGEIIDASSVAGKSATIPMTQSETVPPSSSERKTITESITPEGKTVKVTIKGKSYKKPFIAAGVVIVVIATFVVLFETIIGRTNPGKTTISEKTKHLSTKPSKLNDSDGIKNNNLRSELNESKQWRLNLLNLPAEAVVYIDGVLHMERPVMIKDSDEPIQLKIELRGKTIYKEKILVKSNSSIDLKLLLEPKKKKARTVQKKKRKQPSAASKEKIDTQYPEF